MRNSFFSAARRHASALLTVTVSASVLLMALPCKADALESLARFLSQTHSGQARFTQKVTSPPKNTQAATTTGKRESDRVRTQEGNFAFKRPGQFRFDYQPPFAQTIVADGSTLWLYDVDLNQVTARPQAQTLASTPTALIATATDLNALKRDYTLSNEGAAGDDGVQWVVAVPKPRSDDSSSTLQSIRVGLKASAAGVPILTVLDIRDSLGQRSEITFRDFQVNPALPNSRFQFTPPAGADVIKDDPAS